MKGTPKGLFLRRCEFGGPNIYSSTQQVFGRLGQVVIFFSGTYPNPSGFGPTKFRKERSHDVSWILLQVIQFMTFLSPNVGLVTFTTFDFGSRELTIPKRSRTRRIARLWFLCWLFAAIFLEHRGAGGGSGDLPLQKKTSKQWGGKTVRLIFRIASAPNTLLGSVFRYPKLTPKPLAEGIGA